jgi:hypothetical protein
MWRSAVLGGGLMLAMINGAVAEEAFIGRWSINPAGCTSEGDTASTAPLYATATSVKWFVASCRIGKMYKIGQAVHLEARCSSEGKLKSIPITLDARGDRMRVIWDGVKVEEMRRCK